MHPGRSAFLVLALMLPALCAAQAPAPLIPSLAAMQRNAAGTVNVTLGPVALGFIRLMSRFAGKDDAGSAAAQDVLRGLHTVHIHSFHFATEHAYSQLELEALRTQLTAADWHQVVQVRDRGKAEDVDIYCTLDNHTVTGLVIVAAEPRDFTLVNVVGTIDVNQIGKLRRTFVPVQHGRPVPALAQSDESTSPEIDGR